MLRNNEILFKAGGGYSLENPVLRVIGEASLGKKNISDLNGITYNDYDINMDIDSRFLQLLDRKKITIGRITLAMDPSNKNVVLALTLNPEGNVVVVDAIRCTYAKGEAIIGKKVNMAFFPNRPYVRDARLFDSLEATEWLMDVKEKAMSLTNV